MDTKKAEKLEILEKRELDRQLKIKNQKDIKNLNSAENEQLEFFEQKFNEEHNKIKIAIEKANELDKTILRAHFNTIYKDILALQKYIASSNIFLRSYDVRKYQKIVEELNSETKLLDSKLLPKKKFSMQNSELAKIIEKMKSTAPKNVDTVDSAPEKRIRPKIIIDNCGFSNKSNETLTMSREEVFLKDVYFENLLNCTVTTTGSPSTLHLNNLKNCKIFCGPVSTSVFADTCENCTLIIACQQLRLHSSKQIDIYLHVTSRAIMEDCKNIKIAPYSWKYEGIEDDFQKASLDYSKNNWTCIDDFNWLNLNTASPNWKIIPEDEQVKDWSEFL